MASSQLRYFNKNLERVYNQLNLLRDRDVTLAPAIESMENTLHPIVSLIREHLRSVYNNYNPVGVNLVPVRVQDIASPDDMTMVEEIYGDIDPDDEKGEDYSSSSSDEEEEGGGMKLNCCTSGTYNMGLNCCTSGTYNMPKRFM